MGNTCFLLSIAELSDWIVFTEIGMDPNSSVIKRLWSNLDLTVLTGNLQAAMQIMRFLSLLIALFLAELISIIKMLLHQNKQTC